MIQNPETAPYPAMPMALAPTLVDIVADLEAIGPLLYDLVAGAYDRRRADDEERLLRLFLDQLRERSGIDFSELQAGRPSCAGCSAGWSATGTDDLREYTRYLQAHPEEYQRLTSSFLIKVTEFFRDADLFDYLRDEILPELIDERAAATTSCGSGRPGARRARRRTRWRSSSPRRLARSSTQFNVRIFATDVDVDAINFARRGSTPQRPR